MATAEVSLLSRLDRLDNILRQLEEIKGSRSARSSCASTPSSGTLTSDGHVSSVDFSPDSLEKHCRPIDAVVLETEHKGTLIDRLVLVEQRVLKLCLQLEDELEAEKKRREKLSTPSSSERRAHKKGLKHFVKSCVKGIGNHKMRTD